IRDFGYQPHEKSISVVFFAGVFLFSGMFCGMGPLCIISNFLGGKDMKKVLSILLAHVMFVLCFDACSNNQDAAQGDKTQTATIAAIPKDQLKIGVIHIGDPADGSGYSYTHDLGIQGMQKNLGLSDDQIVRQLNISDSDTTAIRNAIEDCIAQGCN